jgi:hypothetical protein
MEEESIGINKKLIVCFKVMSVGRPNRGIYALRQWKTGYISVGPAIKFQTSCHAVRNWKLNAKRDFIDTVGLTSWVTCTQFK